jgi:uncharacterized protein (DUF1330 family)
MRYFTVRGRAHEIAERRFSMSAYLIAFVDVHDRARFAKEYVAPVGPTLDPFGGRVVAVSDDAKTLEGAVPPGRTVIIEFPDLDRAQSWYASDAYAPLLELRKKIATTSMVILPGGVTARE